MEVWRIVVFALIGWQHGLISCDEAPFEEYVSQLQHLRAKILDSSKYDPSQRPTNDSSSATNVTVNIFWEHTSYMNLEDDWLDLAMVVCNNWHDQSLEWDPDDYGGLESISVFPSEVWYPDIDIVNTSPDDYTPQHITAYLHHDGDLWQFLPITVRIPCTMDLTNYPFDSQVCRLRFASLTYGDDEISLVGEAMMGYNPSNVSSEWRVVSLETSRGSFLNKTSVDVAIGMRRRGPQHRYTATLPWLASIILMLLGFWIPANSKRRLTLACINLLLITLMLQRMAVLLKTSSAVPKIAYFLGNAMVIQVVVAIFAVLVLNIESSTMPIKVPEAVVRFLTGSTGRFLCLAQDNLNVDHLKEDSENPFPPGRDDLEKKSDFLLVAQALDRLCFVVFTIVTLGVMPW